MNGKPQENESRLLEVPKGAQLNSNIQGSLIKPAVERTSSNDHSPRNAINVSKRFATKDQKDNGADDDSYDEFVDQYIAASRDLCIPARERHQYLQNLFRGEALQFYNSNVEGKAADFPEAIRIMKKQFNSSSRQQQVMAELSKLSYAIFVKILDRNKRKA